MRNPFNGKVNVIVAAANEAFFQSSMREGNLSTAELREIVQHMLSAPQDFAWTTKAIEGLKITLASLLGTFPGLQKFMGRLTAIHTETSLNAHDCSAIHLLHRRKVQYHLYALVIEIAKHHFLGRSFDKVCLQVLAAELLATALGSNPPNPNLVERLYTALVRPKNARAMRWSDSSRIKANARAALKLRGEIQRNVPRAVALGLEDATSQTFSVSFSESCFNLLFRRRTEALSRYAQADQISGAGGHGALSTNGLRAAGRELYEQVVAGDKHALCACLEVVSNLPAKTLLRMRVLRSGDADPSWIAWLDLQRSVFCYRLFNLQERGAKPLLANAHLYRSTVSLVEVPLARFIVEHLRHYDVVSPMATTTIGDVLQIDAHSPRHAVCGSSAYKITARKLQVAISAELLRTGVNRWVTALVTNSHFLVSKGRGYYGACRATQVYAASIEMHKLLGWPAPQVQSSDDLIGAAVVPTAEAMRNAFGFLCQQADRTEIEASAVDCLSTRFNAHSNWIAMLCALALAMRNLDVYPLDVQSLCKGGEIVVNDKDIHEIAGPANPIVELIATTTTQWLNLCAETIEELRTDNTPLALGMADKLTRHLDACKSKVTVCVFDSANRVCGVGASTWREALPHGLRLTANFARHHWPLVLMDSECTQSQVDHLLRHQLEMHHLHSSHRVRLHANAQLELRKILEKNIDELQLRIPIRLQTGVTK